MRLNREDLLKELESVLPGLSAREIIEQSSCFVFKDGRVCTYNDEVACSQKSLLTNEVEGAVQALPLIAILRKLPEEEIEVTARDDELYIKGKSHRRAGIRMEQEVLLPIKTVDIPKKWKNLPEDFSDAIHLVQSCASSNERNFVMTCIHIHPDWVEACDNYQAARFKIKTDISKPILIRKTSLECIVDLGMTKFSKTKNWVHFKNPSGLVLSCRIWTDDFPLIAKLLKTKGKSITLPKGLKEAAEKAEVFSAENAEDNRVIVYLQPNKIKIIGQGVSGWFSEIKKIKYKGKSLKFTITPKLLIELVQRHNECSITSKRLRVKSGKFSYVTALGEVSKDE